MKKNNKGFVLVETLVVTVFVMAVFSVIYINFYPLAGEYERREFYDDVDSKYSAYWVKRFIQGSTYDFYGSGGAADTISSNKYDVFQCSDLSSSEEVSFCNKMFHRMNIKQAIITDYDLTEFKQKVQDDDSLASTLGNNFTAYIEYLPNYSFASLNGAEYRVLIEFERHMDSQADSEIYYTYSNMEILRPSTGSVTPPVTPGGGGGTTPPGGGGGGGTTPPEEPNPEPTPPDPEPDPPEEDGVQNGEACERSGDSVCWFSPMGNTVEKFSAQYANGDFDFDVTIMYTQSGVNWQCYTGSNKGFNWFGTSLYGGFRCWEGSACYNNMISQKPTSSGGGIANGVSSCDNLVGF